MTDIDRLARDLRVSGRTLRRAAERGTFVAHRPSPRKVVVPVEERVYLRNHWQLLSLLIQVLRTLHNVRLAVLFGSAARGEATADSDLDIVVRLRRDDYRTRAELAERLASASGRSVQLVSFEQAWEAPMLLADVLRDGRVLVDRDADWPGLRARTAAVTRRAREEAERIERAAWDVGDALAEIHGRVRN
jgi:predicted nucleotidyltransferase